MLHYLLLVYITAGSLHLPRPSLTQEENGLPQALQSANTVLDSLSLQLLPPNSSISATNSVARTTAPLQAFKDFWTTEIPQTVGWHKTNTKRDGGAAEDSPAATAVRGECLEGVAKLFNITDSAGISDGARALDAFGKLGAGYLDGNIYAFGSYDECFSITGTQFCLLHLILLDRETEVTFASNIFYGMCLPSECNADDIRTALNITNEGLSSSGQSLAVDWEDSTCEHTKQQSLNTGAVIMVAVCCLLVFLVAAGSIADRMRHHRNKINTKRKKVLSSTKRMSASMQTLNGQQRVKIALPRSASSSCILTTGQTNELGQDKTANSNATQQPHSGTIKRSRHRVKALDFLIAFSLFKNVPAIFSTHVTSSAITCLQGIRSLSMVWLVLHHTVLWMFIQQVPNNAVNAEDYLLSQVPSMTLTNGFFVIDSFVFFSGLLVSYLTLRTMKRTNGRFPILVYYFHRLLRILPAYSFVLFFYWLLQSSLGNGPVWYRYIGPGREVYENCEKYWWTNFLFINNLYPWKLREACFRWSWFLANDMQFYIVAPLMIVPLYYSKALGGVIVTAFLAASFVVTGTLTGHFDLNLNLFLSFIDALVDPEKPNAVDFLYIKPWTRMPPFLVGILLGYVLFKGYRLRLSKAWNDAVHAAFWIIAVFFCTVTLYGVYSTWHGRPFSKAENILYAMLTPLTWSLGIALIVYACNNGYGWLANKFLSLKLWIPLSRLTFLVYLINPIILITFYASIRETVFITNTTIMVYGLATVVLSFVAALVVAACVEFPFSNLEILMFQMVGLGGRGKRKGGHGKTKEATVIKNITTEATEDQPTVEEESFHHDKAYHGSFKTIIRNGQAPVEATTQQFLAKEESYTEYAATAESSFISCDQENAAQAQVSSQSDDSFSVGSLSRSSPLLLNAPMAAWPSDISSLRSDTLSPVHFQDSDDTYPTSPDDITEGGFWNWMFNTEEEEQGREAVNDIVEFHSDSEESQYETASIHIGFF